MEWKKANKYLPKELKDDFKTHMQSYIMKGIADFERKHDVSIIEHLEEMDSIASSYELKEYLKRHLFTEAEKDIEYKEPNYTDLSEAIEYCRQTLRFIDCEKNKNKKYYFDLGKALFKLRETYDSKKAFVEDMEEKLDRKKSIIYEYLLFYNMCMKYKKIDLRNCNLKFKEIVRNKKIIDEILNK